MTTVHSRLAVALALIVPLASAGVGYAESLPKDRSLRVTDDTASRHVDPQQSESEVVPAASGAPFLDAYIFNQDPGPGGDDDDGETCTGHYMRSSFRWCTQDCQVTWFYSDSRWSTWETGYLKHESSCSSECDEEVTCTHETEG